MTLLYKIDIAYIQLMIDQACHQIATTELNEAAKSLAFIHPDFRGLTLEFTAVKVSHPVELISLLACVLDRINYYYFDPTAYDLPYINSIYNVIRSYNFDLLNRSMALKKKL